ncbi:transcriptional regulator with XRE-family HTH domain [Clostridium beijerinckii]|uniref:helix-turn-helix transcriptional regulator n=1 Tax=Clostridium beijerinckii TaxID=1520 RepID=UPI0015707890|nr:helix-turn-helix transcriptional regulator [Clostridium beijerinckii]NRW91916.1 transcriptional regulator with XRE-family HTH domain [Clostridium beijerinckii]
MDNNILADRLKSKRKELGLTQKDLAQNLNVALSVIAGAETKRGISKNLATKLAEYFKTDINYWINENAESDFIRESILFETTNTVLKGLIDSKKLTSDNVDNLLGDKKLDDDTEEELRKLILRSFRFEVKLMLKRMNRKKKARITSFLLFSLMILI